MRLTIRTLRDRRVRTQDAFFLMHTFFVAHLFASAHLGSRVTLSDLGFYGLSMSVVALIKPRVKDKRFFNELTNEGLYRRKGK